MRMITIIITFITLSSFAEDNLCQSLKQKYFDASRYFNKKCLNSSECKLADLKWNPCDGEIAVNSKFYDKDLKYFQDQRSSAHGACNIKSKVCDKSNDSTICLKSKCHSVNNLYNVYGNFKIHFSLENTKALPSEVVLRRSHRVYCITTPCPPFVTDTKLSLTEGILFVKNNYIPYDDFSRDITYSFIISGYKEIPVTRSKLLLLKDQNLEFKLLKKR